MSTESETDFPVLYGRRIENTRDFIAANSAVMADLLEGRITVKESNAVSRRAREILQRFQAALRLRKIADRC